MSSTTGCCEPPRSALSLNNNAILWGLCVLYQLRPFFQSRGQSSFRGFTEFRRQLAQPVRSHAANVSCPRATQRQWCGTAHHACVGSSGPWATSSVTALTWSNFASIRFLNDRLEADLVWPRQCCARAARSAGRCTRVGTVALWRTYSRAIWCARYFWLAPERASRRSCCATATNWFSAVIFFRYSVHTRLSVSCTLPSTKGSRGSGGRTARSRALV